jgi:hypothetical protein
MSTYPPRYGTDPQSLAHWAVACVASARVLRAEGHRDQAADLEHAATLAAPRPAGPPHQHAQGTAHPSDASNPDRDDDERDNPVRDNDEGAGLTGAFEDAVAEGPSWWR